MSRADSKKLTPRADDDAGGDGYKRIAIRKEHYDQILALREEIVSRGNANLPARLRAVVGTRPCSLNDVIAMGVAALRKELK